MFTHWDTVDDDDGDSSFVLGNCVYIDISGGWRRADCDMPLPGALCYIPPPSEFPSTFLSFPFSSLPFLSLLLSSRPSLEPCSGTFFPNFRKHSVLLRSGVSRNLGEVSWKLLQFRARRLKNASRGSQRVLQEKRYCIPGLL